MSLYEAKKNIMTTFLNQSELFWSILEKQNQSGLLYNERIFFIQPLHIFGYISDTKTTPKSDSFDKAKIKLPIQNLKMVTAKDKNINVKFLVQEDKKKVEKNWVFRAQTKELAKKWQEKMKQQKSKDILRRTSPVLLEQQSLYQTQIKQKSQSKVKIKIPTSPSRSKRFTLSKTFEVSQYPVQKHSKEIGIQANTDHNPPLQQIKPLHIVETKQFGTGMGSMSKFPSKTSLKKNTSFKDANFGTSIMGDDSRKDLHRDVFIQSPSPHQQIQDNYRAVVKHNRSQPSNRKVEPPSYTSAWPLKSQNEAFQKIQPKEEENIRKDVHTSLAQKNPTQYSQPVEIKDQIKNTKSLSNMKYLDNQETDRISLSQIYYQRTSRLIKGSSLTPKAISGPYLDPDSINQETPRKNNASNVQQFKINPSSSQSRPLQIIRQDSIQPDFPLANTQPFKRHPSSQSPSMIRQEHYSAVDLLTEQPWVFKYIKFGQLIFHQFVEYTQDIMLELIKELAVPYQNQQYPAKFMKNGIRYYELSDIEIKFASVEMRNDPHSQTFEQQKVCDKSSIKYLQNQYNNYETLYQYLGQSSKVKVPLVCLNQIQGYVALFKILPKGKEQQIRIREVEAQFMELQHQSKINHNFAHQHHKNLVALDGSYYQRFKEPQNSYDASLNFDLIFIQEIDGYLLPNLTADGPNSQLSLLRKQLVEIYAIQSLKKQQKEGLVQDDSSRSNLKQFSKNVHKAITEIVTQIDTLQIFFFNSQQISRYLHGKGLNIRYLGCICQQLKNQFQKQVLSAQIAARTYKNILRNTLANWTLLPKMSSKQFNIKLCNILNTVLGNSPETTSHWNEISRNCHHYFATPIMPSQINKGFFLISLVQNCNLKVSWERINPEELFKSNYFFSQRNLHGVQFKHKVYPPLFNQQFQNVIRIVSSPESQEGLELLGNELSIQDSPLLPILDPVTPDIKKYLAYFCSPEDRQLPHLKIYQNSSKEYPSKNVFDIRIIQIKWLLKLQTKELYIKKCNQFITLTTRYYGEYHPIFSQLYDIFSVYHSQRGQHDDAITFAKSSLVNTLSLCGTQHPKTSQSYFYLGLYYLKARKLQDALVSFQKAAKIQQNNKNTISLIYCTIVLKIAAICINQNQFDNCLSLSQQTLIILNQLNQSTCEDQLVQCFEMLSRCFVAKGNQRKLLQISQEVSSKLQHISSRDNLSTMLKIYLHPILSDLAPQQAVKYLDIIKLLRPVNNQQNYNKAFQKLKQRISDDTFELHLKQYLKRINSLEQYIREAGSLKQWSTLSQSYQRQTVNDFVSLTEQIAVFLGLDFVTGSLQQALQR